MPEVTPDILSWLLASILRTASFTAAAIRSSRISLSSCIRLSSRLMRLTSWRPVIPTLTRPAPDWPVTSALASSSCIFCIFSCICWACFIRPAMPPFIMVIVLGNQGVNLGIYGFDAVRANNRGELLNHLLHQRIAVDRLFRLALAIGTLTCRCLRRGFLLGRAQLDLQVQFASMILIQGIIQTTLLGRIEQRTVPRIEMQQPAITLDRHQRAVGADTAGHA